jgi:AhpD family alkylhydroperoxidase
MNRENGKTGEENTFMTERNLLNRLMLDNADRVIKRFVSIDSLAYKEGALASGVKELLGLTASLVLRCDDCISWHLSRCREEGLTTDEVMEAMGIAMLVGGSITIPHVRRAVRYWIRETEPEHTERAEQKKE